MQAASQPDGFTLVDFMQAFPSRSIHIHIGQLLQLQQLFASVSDYTEPTVAVIHQQAQQEVANAPKVSATHFAQLLITWRFLEQIEPILP